MLCLPLELAKKMRNGIKNGDFNIEKMLNMDTAQRKGLFEKYIPKKEADFVNTQFEKAMVSSQKEALNNWVKKTFTGKSQSQVKDIAERIGEVNEILAKEPQLNMVEDLVSQKLGIRVSSEEVGKIMEYSKNLNELKVKEGKYGVPPEAYFKERQKMVDYLNSVNPNSNADVAVSVVGRGSMLFSLKSPLINIESNTLFGAMGAIERRLGSLKFNGANSEKIVDYVKYSTELYSKTGYDITTMKDVAADYNTVLGESITHSQGKGPIRAIGRFYENFIFRQAQGVPDVFSRAFATADVANIKSTKIATQEGLTGEAMKKRAGEIMDDALSVFPKTEEGQLLRNESMMEGEFYTYRNKSNYSKLGLGARELLNNFGKIFGLSKAGEVVVPFVKTTANVVGAGIDLSGGSGIKGVRELYKAYKTRDLTQISREHLKSATGKFIHQGFGFAVSYMVASMLKDNDYMPDYAAATNAEKAFARQYNIPFNSIKIGGKWVSFDYFGPVAAPVKALVHARKYGNTSAEKMYLYGGAVLRQVVAFPGVQNLVEFFDKSWTFAKEGDSKEMLDTVYNGTIDFFTARFIPAFMSDIAKGMDDRERKTEGLQKIQKAIPGARNLLEPKINMFGDPIKTESFLSVMFLGSRSRTVPDSPVYSELERLLSQSELPSINDLEYASSRVKLMKEKMNPEEYTKMIQEFGDKFSKDLESTIKKNSYERMSDEEKKLKINDIKDGILEDVLNKYHYKRIKKASEKK